MIRKFYTFFILLFLAACADIFHAQNIWIQNTQNERIYIQVDGQQNMGNHKLVFIQHGLASHMDHQAVQTAKQAFLHNGYTVVTFDSRYSLGKGNNDVEKVRLSTFVDDLTTVINWAKNQPFYSEPFALAGHSLGGASVIEFGATYAAKVNILVPITPVISGKLWEKSCMANMKAFCQQWKKNGTYEYTDEKKHKTAIIPYSVVASCNDYNAYALAPHIQAKTLLIAAQNDIVILPSDIQDLAKTIKTGQTEVIPSSGHNFNDVQNQKDLYQAIDAFLN